MSTTTRTRTDEYVDRVVRLARVHCEEARAKRDTQVSVLPPYTSIFSLPFSHSMIGSFGKAIDWLAEAHADFPDESVEEIIERMAERCDAEAVRRPKWYTKSHLLAAIQFAGQEARP